MAGEQDEAICEHFLWPLLVTRPKETLLNLLLNLFFFSASLSVFVCVFIGIILMLNSIQNTLFIPMRQVQKPTSDFFFYCPQCFVSFCCVSFLASHFLTWEWLFVLCSWTYMNFDFRSNPSRDKVPWCVYLENSVKKVKATQRHKMHLCVELHQTFTSWASSMVLSLFCESAAAMSVGDEAVKH